MPILRCWTPTLVIKSAPHLSKPVDQTDRSNANVEQAASEYHQWLIVLLNVHKSFIGTKKGKNSCGTTFTSLRCGQKFVIQQASFWPKMADLANAALQAKNRRITLDQKTVKKIVER